MGRKAGALRSNASQRLRQKRGQDASHVFRISVVPAKAKEAFLSLRRNIYIIVDSPQWCGLKQGAFHSKRPPRLGPAGHGEHRPAEAIEGNREPFHSSRKIFSCLQIASNARSGACYTAEQGSRPF